MLSPTCSATDEALSERLRDDHASQRTAALLSTGIMWHRETRLCGSRALHWYYEGRQRPKGKLRTGPRAFVGGPFRIDRHRPSDSVRTYKLCDAETCIASL